MKVRPQPAVTGFTLMALLILLCAWLPAVAAAAEPPSLVLVADPLIVVQEQTTTLTATVEVAGATLTLSRKYAGEADFTVVATVDADAAGVATWAQRPAANATYRAEYAKDGEAWSPVAAEVEVGVRPRLRLRVTAPKLLLKGRPISCAVTVWPAHPGGTVVLQRRGKDGWETLQTLTLSDESAARTTWRTDRAGKLIVRARVAADAEHRVGVSSAWRRNVVDPRNPYGVPSRYPRLILVDLSKYKLYYHEHGQVVRVFDCVLGRPGLPTPRGHFKIYAKDPSMGGPYGPRRLRYLGLYAIHGTNEPWLLQRHPRNYSHGCTRLANTNILWLYSRVRVGTPVWNVP